MSDMHSAALPASAVNLPEPTASLGGTSRRWPLILATVWVIGFWLVHYSLSQFELHMFYRWLTRMGGLLLSGLVVLVPWFAQRDLSLRWRFGYLLLVMLSFAGLIWLRDSTLMFITPIEWSLQVLITVGVIWMWMAQYVSPGIKKLGFLAVLLLSCVPGVIVRGEGLTGMGDYDLRWRWTPTSEEKFLASHEAGDSNKTEAPLAATEGDWPTFRGPSGDSQIHGVRIPTDWQAKPPAVVWKHAIGPAWSSMLVVGDRLFTQEQRGDVECTVCYSAASGEQLWAHEAKSRFEEPMAGVGPRATPTFHGGRIYSLGARGRLDAIDAATGKLVWTRDALADCAAEVPVWGFSGSPVVTDDKVIVFIGGTAQQALAAYHAADGEPAWKMPAGNQSYSSPILLTIHGVPQVLYLSDTKLVSVEPATGKQLWEFANPGMGRPTCQPQLVDESRLLISFEPGSLQQVEVKKFDDKWSAEQVWKTVAIKPDFSDYLVYDGHIYGFDADIFCCIELATGKRKWKGGRYGAGQALLFADQGAILVLTEKGELIVVACDPNKQRELAHFKAIEGKTWNHPSYSRGKVYARNAEEMACIELAKE